MMAASRAKKWLIATEPKNEAEIAMRQLGLWFCNQIRSRGKGLADIGEGSVKLPALDTFVNLDRNELLRIAQAVSLSPLGDWRVAAKERQLWAQFMGGMALSYAKSGDVVVVAALLRTAAHLDLRGAWLTDAQSYLLDQQQPEGSFGLLALEEALLGENEPNCDVVMRLTVEVLWAIAEVAGQRRRCALYSSFHLNE